MLEFPFLVGTFDRKFKMPIFVGIVNFLRLIFWSTAITGAKDLVFFNDKISCVYVRAGFVADYSKIFFVPATVLELIDSDEM